MAGRRKAKPHSTEQCQSVVASPAKGVPFTAPRTMVYWKYLLFLSPLCIFLSLFLSVSYIYIPYLWRFRCYLPSSLSFSLCIVSFFYRCFFLSICLFFMSNVWCHVRTAVWTYSRDFVICFNDYELSRTCKNHLVKAFKRADIQKKKEKRFSIKSVHFFRMLFFFSVTIVSLFLFKIRFHTRLYFLNRLFEHWIKIFVQWKKYARIFSFNALVD